MNKRTSYFSARNINEAKGLIHEIIDPMWLYYRFSRSEIYEKISLQIGYEFHCSNIKTMAEAKRAYYIAIDVRSNMNRERKLRDENLVGNKFASSE